MRNQLPIKIGMQLKISTVGGVEVNGRVVRTDYIESMGERGELFTMEAEGLGSGDYYNSIERDISGIKSHAGEPVEYINKQPKDFRWDIYGEDVSVQKKICNSFLTYFGEFRMQGRGLYIYSQTKGSGKTLLSCCIANYLMKQTKMGVKFCSVPGYIDMAKNHEELKEIRNTDFLVLDDIGSQSESQSWIRELLFSLVDWRHTQHLPTIFTANCPIEKCSNDERITQRIYEDSIPVKMPEFSVRKQKADESRDRFMKQLLSDSGDELQDPEDGQEQLFN